jgi:hypothetical protein
MPNDELEIMIKHQAHDELENKLNAATSDLKNFIALADAVAVTQEPRPSSTINNLCAKLEGVRDDLLKLLSLHFEREAIRKFFEKVQYRSVSGDDFEACDVPRKGKSAPRP